MVGTACTALRGDGRPCRATPMADEPFCFWHSPATAEEATEARRLGGAHRRKKRAVASIDGLRGLRTVEDLQATLETVVIETFAIENSISRNRAISGMLATAAKLVEVGDLAERFAVSKGQSRRPPAPPRWRCG